MVWKRSKTLYVRSSKGIWAITVLDYNNVIDSTFAVKFPPKTSDITSCVLF